MRKKRKLKLTNLKRLLEIQDWLEGRGGISATNEEIETLCTETIQAITGNKDLKFELIEPKCLQEHQDRE